MKTALEKNIADIDHLIKNGKIAQSAEALEALVVRRIPRALLAGVAQISWRAGQPQVGLRLLHGPIREETDLGGPATEAEKAEYAACLNRFGANDEAERLLATVSPEKYPRVLLYRAFVQISRWEYSESIPPLRELLQLNALTSYERVIARTNLAAALVYEGERGKATFQLRELLHECSVKRWYLALGRVLELSAENYISSKKWDAAEKFLAKADEILSGGDGVDRFLVRKFRAFVEYLRNPRAAQREGALMAIRAEAEKRGHWETVRQCDRTIAISRKDRDLFLKVFFGTPFLSFRERLRKDFTAATLPPFYSWCPADSAGSELDLAEGEWNGRAFLKVGQAPHRLLSALSTDFYRPFRTATLFSRLFPDEHYNPEHSPARVRQAMLRLRGLMRSEGIPLVVQEDQGFYRLSATAPVQIRVGAGVISRNDAYLARLASHFSTSAFSMSQAVQALGIPRRSAQRIIEEAGDKLERLGRGMSTRYQFRTKHG